MKLTEQQRVIVQACIKRALDNEYKCWGPLSDKALSIILSSETKLAVTKDNIASMRSRMGYAAARERGKTTTYIKAQQHEQRS